MFIGLNSRYLQHVFRHTIINKLLILLAVPGLISLYPSSISIMSAKKVGLASYISEEEYRQERIVRGVLKRVIPDNEEVVNNLAKIVVRHSRENRIDPKLVASVIVVESRGNPLAISNAKSVGLMQIHLPTWSTEINFAEKNPFNPETNIEIGVNILASYLRRHGDLKAALSAYEGSNSTSLSEYPNKILEIYDSRISAK
jgi:soluble lytic murein transglycosylase-like protein